jgi:hypothetical protein
MSVSAIGFGRCPQRRSEGPPGRGSVCLPTMPPRTWGVTFRHGGCFTTHRHGRRAPNHSLARAIASGWGHVERACCRCWRHPPPRRRLLDRERPARVSGSRRRRRSPKARRRPIGLYQFRTARTRGAPCGPAGADPRSPDAGIIRQAASERESGTDPDSPRIWWSTPCVQNCARPCSIKRA